MTATRLHASSRGSDSTLAGRLVSTTTRSVSGCTRKKASPPPMNTSLYSGKAFSFRSMGPTELFSVSITIRATLPRLRAMAHTPAAAPRVSMSAYWWPITYTCSVSSIRSPKALAMTRDFTFVRFSVVLARPP